MRSVLTPWLLPAGLMIAMSAPATDLSTSQSASKTSSTSDVSLVNISRNSDKFGSVFPQVAVSPAADRMVAVAWRQYSLPIDTNAPKGQRTAECHVAISTNAGATFRDTNLMPFLRRERISAAEPELWYCNAPWVVFGPDGTIYAGGSLYTANGVTGSEPKQGRARLTVSIDGGATWSAGTHGITPTTFAPGTSAPQAPENTPWDGANGLVDPATGAFFSLAGGSFAVSRDRARTFSPVYQPRLPVGWERQGSGTMSVSHGVLIVPFFARVAPIAGANCPCLAVATSADYGATPFVPHLIAGADAVSALGTVRYPISAADRDRPGHFAVSAYTADHHHVVVYYTENGGAAWKSATPRPAVSDTPVANANQTGVGYTGDGGILVVWRGFQSSGAFNTYAALLEHGAFGPTITVSAEPSMYPAIIAQGNYGQNNGGGDFTTWITGNREVAFVAFPYVPRGLVEDTYLGRIPLRVLR